MAQASAPPLTTHGQRRSLLVAAKEPPSAVDWAATITDPGQRSAVLAGLYQSWHGKSVPEAAACFQAKGLPVPAP